MKFFQRSKGILGINARNLNYVGHYNTSESKKFADNKLYTKNYLMARGVGVAKIYLVIKKYSELEYINIKTLPESFVIKPNHGYGGEGIILIKQHKGKKFLDINGTEFTWKELYHHMISILDGRYAISGLYDQTIIEEMLEPHEYFSKFIEKGLPDIRIIVFNYVPIIAMLRMPTVESRGKANLHMGAIGVGIDIVTGKATHAVHHDNFIKKLPNGEKITEIELPMWNEILDTAVKAQQASQIKFLAVDIVLTKTGIKILELNARAGLGVQIANQIPLKHRLKKVEDLNVPSPEKGVEVSKALFSPLVKKEKKEDEVHGKKVIGLFEHIDILNTTYTNIPAKIDPHSDFVIFDTSFDQLDPNERYIEIILKGERIRFPFKLQSLVDSEYKVIIGGKVLQNFLIDPSSKKNKETKIHQTESPSIKKVNEKILQNVDKKLVEIDKELNILSFVKPLNSREEKKHFFVDKTYSPQFIYKKPHVDLEKILHEVSALPREVDHPLMPVFVRKIDEIVSKLHLLDAIGTDEFTIASESLYGRVNKQLYTRALQYIKKNPREEDTSKKIGTKQIIKYIEDFLKEHKLLNWKIQLVEKQLADIAINKNKTVLLKKGMKFTQNRLDAVIEHEICTHAYRYENGLMQKYGLLAQGTANYIKTEEGLAVYNQKALNVPLGQKDHWAALRVIAIYHAKEMSFVELFSYMQNTYDLDDESAWKACLKAKRGISDTSKPGCFSRDMIYFDGYLEVSKFMIKHGRRGFKELYVGKIGIEDVPYLEYLDEYAVKYLPSEKV